MCACACSCVKHVRNHERQGAKLVKARSRSDTRNDDKDKARRDKKGGGDIYGVQSVRNEETIGPNIPLDSQQVIGQGMAERENQKRTGIHIHMYAIAAGPKKEKHL